MLWRMNAVRHRRRCRLTEVAWRQQKRLNAAHIVGHTKHELQISVQLRREMIRILRLALALTVGQALDQVIVVVENLLNLSWRVVWRQLRLLLRPIVGHTVGWHAVQRYRRRTHHLTGSTIFSILVHVVGYGQRHFCRTRICFVSINALSLDLELNSCTCGIRPSSPEHTKDAVVLFRARLANSTQRDTHNRLVQIINLTRLTFGSEGALLLFANSALLNRSDGSSEFECSVLHYYDIDYVSKLF